MQKDKDTISAIVFIDSYNESSASTISIKEETI